MIFTQGRDYIFDNTGNQNKNGYFINIGSDRDYYATKIAIQAIKSVTQSFKKIT